MTTYTVILFREEGNDYVKGCHMGSTISDHQVVIGSDIKQVAERVAGILFYNAQERKKDYALCAYEMTILIDGYSADHNFLGDFSDEFYYNSETQTALLYEAIQVAKTNIEELDRLRKEREAAEALVKKQAADKLAEEKALEKRRADYEKLKAEFE